MSEVWILAIVPVLAYILGKLRTKKALQQAELVVREPGSLTGKEMDQFVRDLSLQLNPPTRVTSPTFPAESSHVWNSPSGKRVYMN
ncbi:MAG TPA: hypothetical protein EYO33_00345 [Phycisphaerales bacterium]|nr:hypothetical protein [Phycisphaerales bacterium]